MHLGRRMRPGAYLVRHRGARVDPAIRAQRGTFPLYILAAKVLADLGHGLRRRVDLEHLVRAPGDTVNAPVRTERGLLPLFVLFAKVRSDRRSRLRLDVDAQHL